MIKKILRTLDEIIFKEVQIDESASYLFMIKLCGGSRT